MVDLNFCRYIYQIWFWIFFYIFPYMISMSHVMSGFLIISHVIFCNVVLIPWREMVCVTRIIAADYFIANMLTTEYGICTAFINIPKSVIKSLYYYHWSIYGLGVRLCRYLTNKKLDSYFWWRQPSACQCYISLICNYVCWFFLGSAAGAKIMVNHTPQQSVVLRLHWLNCTRESCECPQTQHRTCYNQSSHWGCGQCGHCGLGWLK